MTILVWVSVVMISVYSLAFAVTLWKQKNRIGSIGVIVLSCACLVLPYFTYVQ